MVARQENATGFFRVNSGKRHDKARAPAGNGFNFDPALAVLDDAIADGQPQPRSLADFFGRKKRFEDFLANGIRNAAAAVFNLGDDMVVLIAGANMNLFDRRTGCIAEIEIEAPDILTDEQMERLERGESVGGKRMGFDAWKCPDETKRVNS